MIKKRVLYTTNRISPKPVFAYTRQMGRYALDLLRSMTIQDVAHHLGLSWDTVKDLQKRDLEA
ncbi:MAG: transposase family protein, partial [Candidatus Ozemobacteraceae bacterium]